MSISIMELRSGEQVFTWENPDGPEVLHFAVQRLCASPEYQALETVMAGITPDYHLWLLANRGADPEYAATLTDEQLREPSALLDMGDSHLLADGTHRVYRHSLLGRKHSPAKLVPQSLWSKFLVSGLPGQP